MKLKTWQREALNFPYSDENLVEKLYIEFFAKSGVKGPVKRRGRPKGTTSRVSKRDQEFIALYKSGKTLEAIGELYGITREGVRQRLKKHGLDRMDGGKTIDSFKKIGARADSAKAKLAVREQKHFEKYGCSVEFIDSISDVPRSHRSHPLRKYEMQRKNALVRKIGWELTFSEWWRIWQESGKWAQRGRGKGYCMARLGDDGPYSAENVEIITIGQNVSDSYITTPWGKRFPNARRKPNAVQFLRCGDYWHVRMNGKYICGLLARPAKISRPWEVRK